MDSKNVETLGEAIRRLRREKGLTTTEIEARSRRGGKKGISNGYITQIENDPTIHPSWNKLQALALGLGISDAEMAALAGEKPVSDANLDKKIERISLKFGGLKPSKRQAAEALIDMLDREIERMANEPD